MTELKEIGAPNVEGFRGRVVIVAGIGIALAIVGWVVNEEQFYRSYLLAYMFWLGLTLGSLGLLMIQHMTGGAWGMVVRRNCEAVARLFPLLALLFIPLLVAVLRHKLYIWTQDPSLPRCTAPSSRRRITTSTCRSSSSAWSSTF
jgi:hypothetical protein